MYRIKLVKTLYTVTDELLLLGADHTHRFSFHNAVFVMLDVVVSL